MKKSTSTSVKKGQTGKNHPAWKGGSSVNKRNEKQREYMRRQRDAVISALGGKCSKCSFSDARALQIDHVEGGGHKERTERTYKGQFNRHVLKSFISGENKYQLLCANCNWIKRVENNETKFTQ